MLQHCVCGYLAERHVFQKMRNPRLGLCFVSPTGHHPNPKRHGFKPGHMLGYDLKPIGQCVVLNAQFAIRSFTMAFSASRLLSTRVTRSSRSNRSDMRGGKGGEYLLRPEPRQGILQDGLWPK